MVQFPFTTDFVFVTILFHVPLGRVPLLVSAGSLMSRAADVALAHIPADRVLLAPVYSWHVVGPVAVLALHGERAPNLADWPWYVAALLAQFAFDLAFSAGREGFAEGVAPAAQLPYMGWACLVDDALAP